jgi:hypothetical protein
MQEMLDESSATLHETFEERAARKVQQNADGLIDATFRASKTVPVVHG